MVLAVIIWVWEWRHDMGQIHTSHKLNKSTCDVRSQWSVWVQWGGAQTWPAPSWPPCAGPGRGERGGGQSSDRLNEKYQVFQAPEKKRRKYIIHNLTENLRQHICWVSSYFRAASFTSDQIKSENTTTKDKLHRGGLPPLDLSWVYKMLEIQQEVAIINWISERRSFRDLFRLSGKS